MKILGIETSCDETACAVVEDGRRVLSSVVYTQIPLHRPYGGVVPEIASRAHIAKIGEVVREGAAAAGMENVDAVAVTYGPGLASSLLVGLSAAKGLAVSLGKPLICVNHMEAHLHAPFLSPDSPDPADAAPALGLAVSGGHTSWVDMPAYGEYRIIGQTLDDAAGEAFDKASKLLGLGYPGGPAIDRAARLYGGNDFIPFPKGRPRPGTAILAGLDADLCTSFSGLKTALLRYTEKHPEALSKKELPRVAASYQEAITDVLAERTANALRRRNYRYLILGGGVSLNARLRAKLSAVAEKAGVPMLASKPEYCGDNAAMVAGLAFFKRGISGDAALAADVQPSLEAGETGAA